MPQADGQEFGKYRLLDRIAAGGMAEIYKARFTGAAGVTKSVVVKKILPHYAGNKNFISMFINEAKIAVGLSHGNIAQIFDFGEIDGEYFLAMEFVDGQPLSRVLRRAREMQIPVMPTPFAVFLAMEMCKGLHYAHTRLDEQGRPLNIVHRDVSPQNVIISYEGQVKLVDFGIAKARTAGRTETEAGAVKGKYVYFSPEQARGKELDNRSDVFAAGICLYEMLCGRLPFEGKMIEVLRKIVHGDLDRPRSVNPDITPALERILMTALALDKNERYASAQAFQEALAGYLYTHAPTFSGTQLANLMSYLYERELVAEGRPVQLPKDFLEQAPLWRKKLPSGPERDPDKMTMAQRPSSKPPREATVTRSEASLAAESGHEEPRSLISRLPAKWLFLGAPLIAMLAAALVVITIGHFGSFSIKLTSSPAGAWVEVDGERAPELTPMLIANLSADRPHEIRVSALGMQTWVEKVQPQRGITLNINATLEPYVPPSPEKEPSPEPKKDLTPTPSAPPADEVVDGAAYPAGTIVLSAKRHAFLVPKSNAAKISLDPKKTYRVWAEGKLSLGGVFSNMNLNEVFFFAEGPELPARDRVGVIGAKAQTLHHVSTLYAFVADGDPDDNTGAIKVRIQERGSRQSQLLIVDGKQNSVEPGPENRFTLSGLEATQKYQVTIREGRTAARTREGKLGRAERIYYTQNAGWVGLEKSAKGLSNASQRVLEIGNTYEMTGASWMKFFFGDDSLADNDGTLEIEVSAIAAPNGFDALKNMFIGNGIRQTKN